MDKYELLLTDVEAILKTVPGVSKVSHGKPQPLTTDSTYTSVYIVPEIDNFSLQRLGTNVSAYDNNFYIRLEVNMHCTYDLEWVQVRKILIDAILGDKAIWTNIVDRDVVSVAHDGYDNYPYKAMAILFEFKLRESCPI